MGAPTVALRPGAPSTPGTAPSLPGSSPTLPKATVQLQAPTQPLGTSFPSASKAATLAVEDEEEEEANVGVVKILAGVGFAAALLVLGFQLKISKIWITAKDNQRVGDWSQLIE